MNTELIAMYRKKKKIPHAEMARRLNMHIAAYQLREWGKTRISADEFAKIVEVLELTNDEAMEILQSPADTDTVSWYRK